MRTHMSRGGRPSKQRRQEDREYERTKLYAVLDISDRDVLSLRTLRFLKKLHDDVQELKSRPVYRPSLW